jgi:hypothetical protein
MTVNLEEQVERRPTRSAALTVRLSTRIPLRWHPVALAVVKTIHSAAFFSIAGSIVLFTWDGVRSRKRRRTGLAAALAFGETLVFVSNNQVCPLTPLAEELGARRGSVTDIFLPDWLSRRIPVLGGAGLIVGLVLHLRNWLAVQPD